MRLSHASGYYHDVIVPNGMRAVTFAIEGGPAACHVYRADDLGVRWIWMARRSDIAGRIVSIAVKAGWWIRVKIEPLDNQKAQHTVATVGFAPLGNEMHDHPQRKAPHFCGALV